MGVWLLPENSVGRSNKNSTTEVVMVKDSMNSTINQRLAEQTQETNFKLEGSGGSTLDDTLRKQYLSSSDE